MKPTTITVSGPGPKWSTTPQVLQLKFTDREHTPQNMRSYEARQRQAWAELEFTRHTEADWVEIGLTEYTTNKAGHISSRAINMTLDPEHATKLAKFVQPQALAMVEQLLDELKAARDFMTEYVPLRDHNGMSLHEDWSWGPAEAAIEKAENMLSGGARAQRDGVHTS